MTKKNTEKTDEQIEQERREREAQEAENLRKMVEMKEQALAEERERRAKAEGAAEALKSIPHQQQQQAPEWTKEQWEEWEEKTGMKKEAALTLNNILSAKTAEIEKAVEERVRKAEERAKQAESRYEQFESSRSYESAKRDYLTKRPQFAKYEREFDEFVKDFPDDVKKDPTRLGSLFQKAEVYIKGKVGDTGMRKTNSGSARFGSDDGDDKTDEVEDYDLSDLRPHERLTIGRILPSKEKNEKIKANRHDLKGDNGVMINSQNEWDKYNKK